MTPNSLLKLFPLVSLVLACAPATSAKVPAAQEEAPVPTISVNGRAVLLDGVEVDSIPRKPTRLTVLRNLIERLRDIKKRRPDETYAVQLEGDPPIGLFMIISTMAMTAGYSQPHVVRPQGTLSFDIPIPLTQPAPAGPVEWLYIRLESSSAVVVWLRQESLEDAPRVVKSSTLPADGESLSDTLRALLTGTWDNPPCDDLVVEAAPSASTNLVLGTIGAVSVFRPCPRNLAVQLRALKSPDPKYPYPSAARSPPGRLPPEKIQSIVRSAYAEFRQCYERALASRPGLSGRVTVRFVIGREGKVVEAEVSETTLPDKEATTCMLHHYRKLVFPRPMGGTITVIYPIQFSPY